MANKGDRAEVLKMINSMAVGTFAFYKGGKIYLKSSSGDETKFSKTYRDKLVATIESTDKINIETLLPAAQSLLTLSNTKNKSYDRNVVAFFVEKSSVYYI